jgi:hypothetical protein
MTEAGGTQGKWRPPAALPAALPFAAGKIRIAWLTLLACVAAIQLAGLGYVFFDTYRVNPAYRAIGLSTDFDDHDRPVIRPVRADAVAAGISAGDRIVSVSGRVLSPDPSAFSIARAMIAVRGDMVTLGIRKPDGRALSARLSRSSRAPFVVAPMPLSVNLRMAVRLFSTLLSSAALLASSLILLLRRPRDPEAVLFGVGFLAAAAAVDPPLLMWMSIGAGWVVNIFTGTWWMAMTIAFAAFPDGRFTPHWLRWSLLAAPLLGLVLAFDGLGDFIGAFVGLAVPLMLLAGQIVRYRRLEPGAKRQQIKWAALGFTAGFLLVGAAIGMSLVHYDSWSAAARGIWLLATVTLFNLGFAILPLGLLISLMRFRLWDVDRVISRSVAYALVSGGIGLLWALLSDVAKQIVASLFGQGHALIGLGLGAIVAAGVFGPTQKLVQRWSKQRFNPSSADLDRLPERLRIWREHCDPAELAARTLDVAMRALHASAGAVFARTPTGRDLLASRGAKGSDDDLVGSSGSGTAVGAHVVHLENQDGLAGWLILSPREDGTRFPKSELAALSAAAAPIAEALRVASADGGRGDAVLSLLDEVQQRISRLEQGRVRPT